MARRAQWPGDPVTTFGAPEGHGSAFDAEVLRHKKARQARERRKEARRVGAGTGGSVPSGEGRHE